MDTENLAFDWKGIQAVSGKHHDRQFGEVDTTIYPYMRIDAERIHTDSEAA